MRAAATVLLCLTIFCETSFSVISANGPKEMVAANKYGNLPMSFEANAGQTDAEVSFISRGSGYTLFLKPTEAVISLQDHSGKQERNRGGRGSAKQTPAERDGLVLGMELVGAKKAIGMGVSQSPEQISYFLGANPNEWRTNIAAYSRVKFDEVYPGIDLVYYGNQQQLEYDFVVSPGASPDWIQLRFKGAEKVEINSGDLVLTAGERQIRWKKPFAFQEQDGERKEIPCNYILRNKREISFQLAAYDPTKPLIIDPILIYSTYLGGSLLDAVEAIAVDTSGNVYVTGETISVNFPTTVGAHRTTKAASNDVFVTKINATGTARTFSTFIGGSGNELGLGIAVDTANNVYVTGGTDSANFPMLNASDTSLAGEDAFFVKLNSTGTSLLHSTYFGGAGYERANAIAVDASGNASIAGETDSEQSFPAKNNFSGGTSGNGNFLDGFIAKFNPALSGASSWLHSSALGGKPDERATAIALDASGNAYLTGEVVTYEDPGISLNFPTVNALQSSYGGGYSDAFVAKVSSAGNTLMFSTYLGGFDYEYGTGIVVDGSNNVYVAGQTVSTNFPILNAFQPMISDSGGFLSEDAFVTKLGSAGTNLLYSTFFGGDFFETAYGIAVDKNGYVYIAGQTRSENLPTTQGAYQTTWGGGINDPDQAFLAKLNPAISGPAGLVFSSYFGGGGSDNATGIAIDANQNVYIGGLTDSSTDFPITSGVAQSTYGGGFFDGFIAKFASPADLSLGQTVSPEPVTVGSNVTYVIQINNNGLATFSGVTMTNQLPGSIQYVSAITTRGSISQAGGLITCNIGTLTNNMNATITIVGTTTNAGTITNIATVTAIESELNMANNTAATLSTVRGIADMTVTITNLPTSVAVGGYLTNTINVRNKGPWTATAVTMNHNFPAGTTYVIGSAQTTHGTFGISSGAITANLGTMTNGAEATITVVLNVTGSAVLTNTATVTAFEIDPIPANNSATDTATVSGQADVQITGSGLPSISYPGNTLTYTLRVTNVGPSTATGVVVSNTLPASVIYGSATSTLGSCTRSGQLVTCNIGTLNNSNSATITIVVTNSVAGVITNIANLFTTSADGNSGNNTATIINTVALPALSITRAGTNVTLTWPSAATGFQLQSLQSLAQMNWAAVTNNPVLTNSQFSVTRPLETNAQHFRLRRP